MRGYFIRQFADKPGSVVDDHLSSLTVTDKIERIAACGRTALICRPPCSRQGLPSSPVTRRRCGLLPHSFHPYLRRGGFVSVALSL